MRLQPAVLDPPDQRLQLAASPPRQERHARAFDGRVAGLHYAIGRNIRDQADALRGRYLEVAPESAREIEDVDGIEVHAVTVEHHLQSGDVRALGLRQLVDVALEKVQRARGVE